MTVERIIRPSSSSVYSSFIPPPPPEWNSGGGAPYVRMGAQGFKWLWRRNAPPLPLGWGTDKGGWVVGSTWVLGHADPGSWACGSWSYCTMSGVIAFWLTNGLCMVFFPFSRKAPPPHLAWKGRGGVVRPSRVPLLGGWDCKGAVVGAHLHGRPLCLHQIASLQFGFVSKNC